MNNNSKFSFVSLILLGLFCLPLCVTAQQKKADPIELTSTDITRAAGLHASKVSLWGVKLGMGMAQVNKIFAGNKDIKLERDPTSDRKLYIYDYSQDTAKALIGYLKWLHGKDTGLKEIILFPKAAIYLQGLTPDLLSAKVEDPESELYTSFLGKPTMQEVRSEIPSIGFKIERFYYSRYLMLVEKQMQDGITTYNLVLYQP